MARTFGSSTTRRSTVAHLIGAALALIAVPERPTPVAAAGAGRANASALRCGTAGADCRRAGCCDRYECVELPAAHLSFCVARS
jgi:hypothetical protein